MAEFKARPTVYKGIHMRSRLEAGYAAWLDQWHFDWEYEPCAFATEAGQYLPDFRIDQLMRIPDGPTSAYIEVKPPSVFADDQHEVLSRLLRSMWQIKASEPNAVLLLATPGSGDFWLETTSIEQDPFLDEPWPMRALWVNYGTEIVPSGLALARGLQASRFGPWPADYWKVP